MDCWLDIRICVSLPNGCHSHGIVLLPRLSLELFALLHRPLCAALSALRCENKVLFRSVIEATSRCRSGSFWQTQMTESPHEQRKLERYTQKTLHWTFSVTACDGKTETSSCASFTSPSQNLARASRAKLEWRRHGG